LVASAGPARTERKETRLSASDPNYDQATDTYRQIYRGHDNASAVTNTEGLTVYFDPDTHEVLGFTIAKFSAYYEAHKTPQGDFEVSLPKRVPTNLEEEMDFDAEALRSGVRIAEFY
jgi:L-ascorbate metabolism protein UlaG (beta-lactamase superfamily)